VLTRLLPSALDALQTQIALHSLLLKNSTIVNKLFVHQISRFVFPNMFQIRHVFHNTSAINNAHHQTNAINPIATKIASRTLFATLKHCFHAMTTMIAVLIPAMLKRDVSLLSSLPTNASNAQKTLIALPLQFPMMLILFVLLQNAVTKDNVLPNHLQILHAFLNQFAPNLAQPTTNANLMDVNMMLKRTLNAHMSLTLVMMERIALQTLATLQLVCVFINKVKTVVQAAKQHSIAPNGELLTILQTIVNNHSVTKHKELVLLSMFQM
jgi:hypothetical protein